MLLPLTKAEISQFLRISLEEVDLLWRSGALERNDFSNQRLALELRNTTLADLLLYYLCSAEKYSLPHGIAEEWVNLACDLWEPTFYINIDSTEYSTVLAEEAAMAFAGFSYLDILTISNIIADGIADISRIVFQTETSSL